MDSSVAEAGDQGVLEGAFGLVRSLGREVGGRFKEEIGGEIADEAVADAVVGEHGDGFAAEEECSADEGEITGRCIRNLIDGNDELIALLDVEVGDEIDLIGVEVQEEAIGSRPAEEDVRAEAAVEQVVAWPADEKVIA